MIKKLSLQSIILPFIFILICAQLTAQEEYKKYISLSYAEIDSLVLIPYQKGDFNQCIVLMQAGREKAGKEFGELDSVFANYTGDLGFFHQSLGNYDQALPLLIQAVNIDEKTLGKEHIYYAGSINNLAILYKDMGNYDMALPLYIQSKNIYEKKLGIEHPDYALSLNNLADLHQEMGNYDLALPLYIQAKNIREKALGKDHPSLAVSLNNLALLHKRMGDEEMALPLYIRAIQIKEKRLGKDHPSLAISLNNLGSFHQNMGNYNLALPLYIQAKNIRKKAFGENHPDFAISLNNLAYLYQDMGNYELALPLYTQSSNIYEKVFGKDHPDYAMSLNNLALLHQKMAELPHKFGEGHYTKAWEFLEQAMNSSATIPHHLTFTKTWADSLAEAPYPSYEHLDKMIKSLKLTYLLLSKDNKVQSPLLKQISVTDLATTLLDKAGNRVSNENDKLRLLSQSNDWMLNSLKILDVEQHKNKAFLRADQNKSVLLFQTIKSETTYQLGELPDSLIWKDKKLLKKQSQLEAKLLEKREESEKDSLRNELNHLNLEIVNFVKMIKENYPKYHKLKYQQVDAKIEEIQTLLDNKTALIEYVISDSVLHIFKVTKNEVIWVQQPLLDSILKVKIKLFHHMLSDYKALSKDKNNSWDSYAELAYWFYQNMLEPVLKTDKGLENLVIVTDGELGHLPFETFLTKKAVNKGNYKDLPYLLKDYNISYNYSATLWKENKESKKSKNNGKLMAMAANYELKGDTSLLNELRLPTERGLRKILSPLPAARAEVEALQKAYKGYFAFDLQASEKMIKQLAPEYAIIHLAMHGLLDEKRPMLSSLAFTEDGDSTESNFWQAHEISKMQLNANLVVLSACETGYGKFEKGNGIASLARAVMYAGAPALVVSLWQVNDVSTGQIMQLFYENLAKGMPKDLALREAKLKYISDAKNPLAAHPAFWSPFILIGDNSPVMIQRKINYLPWVIGSGVTLLLLLGIGINRYKRKNVA